MQTKIRIIPVLAILMLVNACASRVATAPGKTPQPVLDSIALQVAQIADGAKTVRQIKEVLLAHGQITPETSNRYTKALIKLDTSLKVVNERLATYQSFTPAAKEDLKKLFFDIETARSELTQAGVLPASSGIDKAFLVMNAAIAALDVFLK